MITKWTNIKSVLFELERIIPKEFYNEGRLLEDCMVAVDKIGAIITYEPKIKFVEVDNYKACIPIGCLQINQIAYKTDFRLSNTDIMSLAATSGDCVDCGDAEPVQPYDINNITYASIINSNYFNINWKPLRLSTNSFALAVHSDNCVNIGANCQHEYSVSPDGTMTFNFQKGYICIAYYAYPVDCDNIPLIPDDEDYKAALRNYCLMLSWELRWNMKEDGAAERYMKYQQLWGLMKAKATASIRMPDVAQADNLMHISLKLIPNTRRFNNFFSTLNSPENLKMQGDQYRYR